MTKAGLYLEGHPSNMSSRQLKQIYDLLHMAQLVNSFLGAINGNISIDSIFIRPVLKWFGGLESSTAGCGRLEFSRSAAIWDCCGHFGDLLQIQMTVEDSGPPQLAVQDWSPPQSFDDPFRMGAMKIESILKILMFFPLIHPNLNIPIHTWRFSEKPNFEPL